MLARILGHTLECFYVASAPDPLAIATGQYRDPVLGPELPAPPLNPAPGGSTIERGPRREGKAMYFAPRVRPLLSLAFLASFLCSSLVVPSTSRAVTPAEKQGIAICYHVGKMLYQALCALHIGIFPGRQLLGQLPCQHHQAAINAGYPLPDAGISLTTLQIVAPGTLAFSVVAAGSTPRT